MTTYWLVSNPMYAIKHVIKANRFKRLIRSLGLGYENVLSVATCKTEDDAAQAFQKRGFDMGYRSNYGLNRFPSAKGGSN